jgi:protein SCO1
MTASLTLRLAGILAAAAAGVLVAHLVRDREERVQLEHGTLLEPAQPLPSFSLVDERGEGFTRDQLQHQWSLVFFGFTHCPDVCPTTLAKLGEVRRRLQDLPAQSVPQVVLVSVDPERDTPAALAQYLAGFDGSFRGVTGSVADIGKFAAALGVAHRKVEMGGGQYMVDHTAVVMLVDPRGARAAIFSPPLEAEAIAEDFRRILAVRS